MHILILIIAALVSIIAIVLIVAFVSSAEVTITGDIIINQPVQKVFNFIKLLKSQEKYNKWVMASPQSREYKGVDGTVGSTYSWQSDNKQMGKGEQEIKQVEENERMDSQIHFMQPYDAVANVSMRTSSIAPNQTKVSIIFTGERNYKMRIAYLLFNIKKMLSNDFRMNLENLKTVLETN